MSHEVGKAVTFNPIPFLECAKQLVDADEVERALALLDNVPAYFRDFPPPEILEYKNKILQHMITANGYMTDNHDCNINSKEEAKFLLDHTLRGKLIQKEIAALQGFSVSVVDVGPGEYWIPKGVDGEFFYKPIAMDSRVYDQALKDEDIASKMKPAPWDAVRIFVALEVIEHISNPRELAWEAAKHFQGKEPHYIHLSTPLYTYDSKPKDWASHKLPHLRAYTPREFIFEAQRLWPHYEWQFHPSDVMSLRGIHPSAPNRQALI